MFTTKRQRITARTFRGTAGTIQHQLFVGILLTLDIIILATMIGIFTLAARTTSGIQIYIIVGICAYLGAVVGYYLVLRFMSNSLKTVETIEKSLTEIAQSEQILSAHPLLPAGDEALPFVTAYNRLVTRLNQIESSQLEFLAVTAHELRSPAASIGGYAELLSQPEYRADPKNLDHCQQAIARQARQILQLSEDITTAAKLNSGATAFHMAPFDLVDLVTQVTDELRVQSQRELTFENQAGEVCLIGDALRIREALLNLIENALKYSAPHQPVEVRLTLGDQPGWVSIAVRDHGIGISDRDKTRLFIRFGRIQNEHTRNIPGTGLGLYIVKGIILRHKGRISVQSNVGVGSTFTIDLPIRTTHRNPATRREIK